jgi:hypothetical protein
MRVQQCSTSGCSRQAAFTTKSQAAWCLDCVDAVLRAGGVEAVEPFTSAGSFRLTRCLACGVEAHYKLQYTVDRNSVGEKTCRACFYRAMSARTEDRAVPGVTVEYRLDEIVQRLERSGWELLDLLSGARRGEDPVVGRCRFCGRIQAARISDFGFGCTCSRKTRSRHPTDKTPARASFATSGSAALAWWDHEVNDAAVLATATIRARRIVSWRCPACDLRFEKQIAEMAERPACPGCEQRQAAERTRERERLAVTSVADVPELLAAWADDADPAR